MAQRRSTVRQSSDSGSSALSALLSTPSKKQAAADPPQVIEEFGPFVICEFTFKQGTKKGQTGNMLALQGEDDDRPRSLKYTPADVMIAQVLLNPKDAERAAIAYRDLRDGAE